MPGIPLPWQIVIVVSVIAGVALVLVALGRRSDGSQDRSRRAQCSRCGSGLAGAEPADRSWAQV